MILNFQLTLVKLCCVVLIWTNSSAQNSTNQLWEKANAYYKTGDVNNAILNYERAKVLAPHDEDIAFNLRRIKAWRLSIV